MRRLCWVWEHGFLARRDGVIKGVGSPLSQIHGRSSLDFGDAVVVPPVRQHLEDLPVIPSSGFLVVHRRGWLS